MCIHVLQYLTLTPCCIYTLNLEAWHPIQFDTICLSNEQLLLSWEGFAICTSARRSAPCRCVTSWAQCLRVSRCLKVASPKKHSSRWMIQFIRIDASSYHFYSLDVQYFLCAMPDPPKEKAWYIYNNIIICKLIFWLFVAGRGIHLWLSFLTSSQGPVGPGRGVEVDTARPKSRKKVKKLDPPSEVPLPPLLVLDA